MATDKKNPYVSVPTFYERFGYGAPVEDRLYRKMNAEDQDVSPEGIDPDEEKKLDKELTDEYEKERQEFIRKQKESMRGYNPYVKQAEMGRDYSTLLEMPGDGASKEEVLALQKNLNRYGYGLSEDGIIGPKTKAAFDDYNAKVKSQDAWPSGEPDDAIVETAPEQGEPGASMTDMYGSLVPSFFSRMLDMSKPSQYLTSDERMRNAARLARRIAPFADSGMAKNIYADAMNRMKTEHNRADTGEQNVLQRRTTAENMWGHYSPAITQALTNSSVFMQRAYQSEEEGLKLQGFAETARNEAREMENILRDQYEQRKINFYVKGKPITFDEFGQLVEGNKVSLIDSNDIETNEAIAALAGQYRQIIAKNAQAKQLEDEAKKNFNMSMQQQMIADSNKNFAKKSQAFFGFPAMELPDIKMPEKTPQAKKGTRQMLDDEHAKAAGAGTGGPDEQASGIGTQGSQGVTVPGIAQGKKTGAVPVTGTARKGAAAVPNQNVAVSGQAVNEKPEFETQLEEGRRQYLKFEANNKAITHKYGSKGRANAGEESAPQQYAEAYRSALKDKRLKDFTVFVFNDFRNRKGGINDFFRKAVDPSVVAFSSKDIQDILKSSGIPEGSNTVLTNILTDLATGRGSPKKLQENINKLETTLKNAKALPTDYKVEVYPDGRDIAIIPVGMTIWPLGNGKYKLVNSPKGRT